MADYTRLPNDLPVPKDDGAGDHLVSLNLPNLALDNTSQKAVNLSKITGWQVIFCYPLTARPDAPLPEAWNLVPGARGCTPQACSIRDAHSALKAMHVSVFGMSTQTSDYQKEAAERLHLPYSLLSDHAHCFIDALDLPTFTWLQQRLNKRLTIIALDGKIQHIFYPVFPPDTHIHQVIEWLNTHV